MGKRVFLWNSHFFKNTISIFKEEGARKNEQNHRWWRRRRRRWSSREMFLFSFFFSFSENGRHGSLFIANTWAEISTVIFVLLLEGGSHLSYSPLGLHHVSSTKKASRHSTLSGSDTVVAFGRCIALSRKHKSKSKM